MGQKNTVCQRKYSFRTFLYSDGTAGYLLQWEEPTGTEFCVDQKQMDKEIKF